MKICRGYGARILVSPMNENQTGKIMEHDLGYCGGQGSRI